MSQTVEIYANKIELFLILLVTHNNNDNNHKSLSPAFNSLKITFHIIVTVFMFTRILVTFKMLIERILEVTTFLIVMHHNFTMFFSTFI